MDQLEALGSTTDARRQLFRGRLTDDAFTFIDQLNAEGDKQTDLIKQVFSQFEGIETQRQQQEELNALQAELNELTQGGAETTNNIAAQIQQIRAVIAQVRDQQNQAEEILTNTTNS